MPPADRTMTLQPGYPGPTFPDLFPCRSHHVHAPSRRRPQQGKSTALSVPPISGSCSRPNMMRTSVRCVGSMPQSLHSRCRVLEVSRAALLCLDARYRRSHLQPSDVRNMETHKVQVRAYLHYRPPQSSRPPHQSNFAIHACVACDQYTCAPFDLC